MTYEHVPSVERTPARFLSDLVRAAAAAGVGADRRSIAVGFAPFADLFCAKPVELRTTSQPSAQREVSFRFVDESARGRVWQEARSWFELGGPPAAFMSAVHEAFPLRAEGADADARTGFRKAWAFLEAGFSIRRFLALDAVPPGLAAVREIATRHGLQHLSIVGTDHHHGTCNLYPMLPPGWASRERLRELARDLRFAPMEDGWLEHCERAVAANLTFSWSSPELARLAFYRPAMGLEELPDDPVLRKFAIECPTIAPQRAFIASITYSRGQHYRKLEVDYDGEIVPVLVRCAMVPPAQD